LKGGGAVQGLLSFLLDVLIPRSCLVCGRELEFLDPAEGYGAGTGLSHRMGEFLAADFRLELWAGISVPAEVLCPGCWLKLEPAGAPGFLACPGEAGALVPVIAPFFTNDELLALVRFLKFAGGRTAVPALGWWMARSLEEYIASLRGRDSCEPLLVPVPLHRSRERSRGYNQASLLAGEVAQRLGLEVDSRILERIRSTKSQSTLESGKRTANVKGAFDLSTLDPVTCRNIIVIDDLVTTGETALACIAALARANPLSIAVLAAGRARG
jgi:ComF family protein